MNRKEWLTRVCIAVRDNDPATLAKLHAVQSTAGVSAMDVTTAYEIGWRIAKLENEELPPGRTTT